ncbi:hypothetical protein IMZ11_19375 [Microtetraspora sp. AC03309]|uniref:hypothetical protein n=1 Tax=Microtetraspora sp. AC03309 TaxID=2779376 RepID=UPI001E53CFD6|nr:hypothetical protein [Microtetraspora sp. AC03309]MCC5577792.1 hypothetical protein [Microtetraspora sp. AC03309]
MTTPLTGQRSRSELIAELYERHAAGLFAYCHDQLGETSSAADAVVSVFTGVPTDPPPARAALYALARREIYRRDVSYALPAVDSVADPATALIERVFRDIRPHQREVLLLSAVCGLSTGELSWVFEVATDTAAQLTLSARRRFSQTLVTATTAARSAPFVPVSVAEVYDAIVVSPIEDVLARLPWRRPAAAVRGRVLSALPIEEPGETAAPAAPVAAAVSSTLPTRKLWPTTPAWPLPLTDPNQVTNTCVLPAEALAPPKPGRRPKHEATTEPMPRLRPSLLAAFTDRKRRASLAPAELEVPQASAPAELDAPPARAALPAPPPSALPAPVDVAPPASETATHSRTAETGSPTSWGSAFGRLSTPGPDTQVFDPAGFGTAGPDTQVFDAFRPAEETSAASAAFPALTSSPAPAIEAAPAAEAATVRVDAVRVDAVPTAPAEVATPAESGTTARADKATKQHKAKAKKSTRAKAKARETTTLAMTGAETGAVAESRAESSAVAESGAKGTARSKGTARGKEKARSRGKREHHYDWAWEIVGFLICLAIALIVFFSLPTFVTP